MLCSLAGLGGRAGVGALSASHTARVERIPPPAALFERSDLPRKRERWTESAAQESIAAAYTTGERPPSTLMAVPVIYEPGPEARKQARVANPSAVPTRPSGTPVARSLVNPSKTTPRPSRPCPLTHCSP